MLASSSSILWSAPGGPLVPPGPPAVIYKTLDEVEPRTPISALPFTINRGGSFYLTGCLIGVAWQHGITISANDVTLDLNGFTMSGVDGSLDGIRVSGARTNIAIYNGVVRDWRNDGIDCASTYNSQMRDLRASNNGSNGIETGNGCLVKDSQTRANSTDGIVTRTGCTITDRAASENRSDGIVVSTGGTVSGCSAYNNGFDGIRAAESSTVMNSTAYSNTNGIVASNGSTVSGCTANNTVGPIIGGPVAIPAGANPWANFQF